MYSLSEAGRLSLVSLFRQIIQQHPPIEVLHMGAFSAYEDVNENIGEIVLETLLSFNINAITKLTLYDNPSWYRQPRNKIER